MEKPHKAQKKDPGNKSGLGPLQVVAHNLARWVLMLSIGMGVVSIAAFYLALWVEGAMLISIFLVSVTLYFFIKWWPEEDKRPAHKPEGGAPITAVVHKPVRVLIPSVRIGGPPKVRCLMILREMVRRQESFQISQQGAEAFAKTIRYMLRSKI
jgi:hypothetical protein